MYVISNIFLPHYVELKGADYQTFQPLRGNFGKDSTNVYYSASILPNADPSSFQTLSDQLGQDRRYLFYTWHPVREESERQIVQQLTNAYWKDKTKAYYEWKEIPGANPQSFKVVADAISEDADAVFYEDSPLEGVIPGRYTLFRQEYVVSENAVYYRKRKMNVVEPKSFRLIEDQVLDIYFTDGHYIYRNWQRLRSPDVATFTVLRDGFSRDKNHIYWSYFIVINADPDTFEMVQGKTVGKDKSGVLTLRNMVLQNDWDQSD